VQLIEPEVMPEDLIIKSIPTPYIFKFFLSFIE